MTAVDYSGDTTPVDRRASSNPTGFHRRLKDTFFNQSRWPAFVLVWLIGGGALLVYFLLLMSGYIPPL
jgi:hypothetical protein